jgi:hypothetical protein
MKWLIDVLKSLKLDLNWLSRSATEASRLGEAVEGSGRGASELGELIKGAEEGSSRIASEAAADTAASLKQAERLAADAENAAPPPGGKVSKATAKFEEKLKYQIDQMLARDDGPAGQSAARRFEATARANALNAPASGVMGWLANNWPRVFLGASGLGALDLLVNPDHLGKIMYSPTVWEAAGQDAAAKAAKPIDTSREGQQKRLEEIAKRLEEIEKRKLELKEKTKAAPDHRAELPASNKLAMADDKTAVEIVGGYQTLKLQSMAKGGLDTVVTQGDKNAAVKPPPSFHPPMVG